MINQVSTTSFLKLLNGIFTLLDEFFNNRDNAGIIAIVEKLIKQRKDSIEQFQKAGRTDLVDQESKELGILQAYMPAQLSAAEVQSAIQKVISDLGASGPQDMGKVIGALKAQLAGKADMGMVSGLVKAALAK